MTQELALPPGFLQLCKVVWQDYRSEQREIAERILLGQMRKGRPWRLTEKAGAAALFSYLRAAQEGVASRNLELLAEALVRSAEEATFAPDEFRRHSTRIADLSREEILITAELIRCRREFEPEPETPKETDGWTDGSVTRADPGADEAQRDGQIWSRVRQSLLAKPAIFPNEKLLHGYAGALTRTGWVSYIGGWDDGMFRATPLLDVIERLVEWQEASIRMEDNS